MSAFKDLPTQEQVTILRQLAHKSTDQVTIWALNGAAQEIEDANTHESDLAWTLEDCTNMLRDIRERISHNTERILSEIDAQIKDARDEQRRGRQD